MDVGHGRWDGNLWEGTRREEINCATYGAEALRICRRWHQNGDQDSGVHALTFGRPGGRGKAEGSKACKKLSQGWRRHPMSRGI